MYSQLGKWLSVDSINYLLLVIAVWGLPVVFGTSVKGKFGVVDRISVVNSSVDIVLVIVVVGESVLGSSVMVVGLIVVN